MNPDFILKQYRQFQSENLNLDLTRGKPSPAQLHLSDELDGILAGNFLSADGTDVRNYGCLDGLFEAKILGGELLGLAPAEVFVGGNSSLQLMQLYVAFAFFQGACGEHSAWKQPGNVTKFLCPVPGYDRHFTICENLGIEMIPVPLTEQGPDMDLVEKLVAFDASIQGIWCVPKYSNPTGCVYSDEVVDRLARMKTASPFFRILWDDAYAVHHLTVNPPLLKNIMSSCREHGTMDRVISFTSTSKITFAGAGISFLGASESNQRFLQKQLSTMTIGFDKVNQLRHVRFLKDELSIQTHMEQHRALLQPKFELVLQLLCSELGGRDMGEWTIPQGGYFISFNSKPGLARKIVQLAKDAGVKLTPAGATFPHGKDPHDSNIRIAPSYPPLPELQKAMEVFVTCVQLASLT